MKIIEGGIFTPNGFEGNGIHAGIRKNKNCKDLSLIYSKTPCKMAGVYTTNLVKAAPVNWNQNIDNSLQEVHGIIINSGIANACTGKEGDINNEAMAKSVANHLNIDTNEVLVASTGVIGVQLPIQNIINNMSSLVSGLGDSADHNKNAAEGILTTDTYTKTVAMEIIIQGKSIKIGGMAKGSGMIHPNMATMLAFITTDLNISKHLLKKALKDTVVDTYNMISVDGDTSTNDMGLILANGLAGNEEILEEDDDYDKFKEALMTINKALAIKIVEDGEGASKLLEVKVKNGYTKVDTRKIAKSIIDSNLVKTAFFGEDANWGRILAAAGYSGAQFNPEKINLSIKSEYGDVAMLVNGECTNFDESLASKVLSARKITINLNLQDGNYDSTAWGCDLSYDYVKINGSYRT